MKKRVLNVHIAKGEAEWLRRRADEEGLSITMVVRLLVREAMRQERAA